MASPLKQPRISDLSGARPWGWKATGHPTVRKQREKWTVRVDGIDTETGKHRPRELGTYQSQRSAMAAARSMTVEDRLAPRDTVTWLVRRYVAARCDVTLKAREQYAWVLGKQVTLSSGARDDRDRYQRCVDVAGVDAQLALLNQGLAIARYDSHAGYGAHPREATYVAADAAHPTSVDCPDRLGQPAGAKSTRVWVRADRPPQIRSL